MRVKEVKNVCGAGGRKSAGCRSPKIVGAGGQKKNVDVLSSCCHEIDRVEEVETKWGYIGSTATQQKGNILDDGGRKIENKALDL